MPRSVASRLDELIAEKGQSKRAVSLAAGLSESAVRDIIRYPKNSPTLRTIEALSRALGASPEYLAFGVDAERAEHPWDRSLIRLPVKGEVACGVWREMDSLSEHEMLEEAPMCALPDYASEAQFALRVRGTSINRLAREGDLLHCIDLSLAHIQPKEGELVIVRQMRDAGQLCEATAKIFRRSGSIVRLEPDSDDARWKPIILDPSQPVEGVEIAIIAVVEFIYRAMRRG